MASIMGFTLEPKAQEIMDFLSTRVFDPILNSPNASAKVKTGVRYTVMHMEQRKTALGMANYFWAAIRGTERSVHFADMMQYEGFDRFEEVFEEFRRRFDNNFLTRP
jgi:hypothetical protein